MIITKKYAEQLVQHGKAIIESCQTCTGSQWPDGRHYQIVTRLDIQRIDHYPV